MATKLRRTLLIGLGGTGMKTILNAKKMLYDTYGEIPPMIGFLGIDTDGGVYTQKLVAKDGNEIGLNTNEQMAIGVNNPIDTFNRRRDNFDWLPDCNVSALETLSDKGAGQVRTNGRFAITMKEEDVQNRILAKVQQIKNAANIDNDKYSTLSNDLEIHLVFSISGGTGCGTFINMAYLLHELLPDAKISGYGVMAEVFRAMMQGASVARVRPNALGAIADLDFLMSLTAVSKPVNIKWLKRVQKVKKRPFDAFYFIDNTNENGDIFSNVDQLCEMISLSLITSMGDLGAAVASVADNVSKVIGDGSLDVLNKKAWASGFGVSEIIYNSVPLAEIYINKAKQQVINHMLNGGCDDPSLLANNWIDTTQIRENKNHDDVIDYFMSPNSPRQLTDLDSPDSPKAECDMFLNTAAMEKKETLQQKLTELEERVGAELTAFLKEQLSRECGVYNTEQILYVLRNQVDECDREIKDETLGIRDDLAMAEGRLDSDQKELEACYSTFLKRGKKEKTQEVLDSVRRVATLRREIARRDMARQFYGWLLVEIEKKFDIINNVRNNLKAVHDESARNVERLRNGIQNSSFFQIDLAQSEVDRVSCAPGEVVFNDFIRSLGSEGVFAFSMLTTKEVADAIESYARSMPMAREMMARTIDDVLDSLSEEEFAAICEKAIKKSKPLFTYTTRGYDMDIKSRPDNHYYVGVADKSKSRIVRNNYLKNHAVGDNMNFSATGVKDRVIIYHQIGVIPPFMLDALDIYREEYDRFEKQKPATSHWDRGVVERMNEERYDINPRNIQSEEEVLRYWVLAIITGIVEYDAALGQYKVKSPGLGGKKLYGYWVNIGSKRKDAYAFFTKNYDVVGPDVIAELEKMDVPGPDNRLQKAISEAKAADGPTYVESISRSPIAFSQLSLYKDEEEQLMKEIDILDNIKLH
ncbi:MAG: hypothetical protein HDS00_01195 [Bacteroides sp.]|nr:hypothetical protein [Bacteroides sp.]